MNYIRARLKQPTTWIGVAAAAAALQASNGQVTPEIVSSLLVAFGFVHINEQPRQP